MYKTLAGLFWFIRQFYIPNPFEVLGEGITVYLSEVSILLSPETLNFLADPIIFSVTFFVVGLYYSRGSFPEWGSILYMLFYVVHIGLIYLVMAVYPSKILMTFIILVYITAHITWNYFSSKANGFI